MAKRKTYFVEFGERGGYHSSDIKLHNKTDAAKLAASLVLVFSRDNTSYSSLWRNWYLLKNSTRQTWTSDTHYVALSLLSDENEGPASATLWTKGK